jgi:hypothetical protein
MSNVILYNRKPAIQISDTEFKYLTETELVAIIQAQEKLLEDANTATVVYISQIAELKNLLAKPKKVAKEIKNDSDAV